MALNPTLSLAGQRTLDEFNLSEPRSPTCKWGPPEGSGDVVWREQAALREWKPLLSLGLDALNYRATDCYRGNAEAGREGRAGSVVGAGPADGQVLSVKWA